MPRYGEPSTRDVVDGTLPVTSHRVLFRVPPTDGAEEAGAGTGGFSRSGWRGP
ncbi:hypothetical protein GCM10023214_74700 [Amycolatopsis dongchuanensis]|uniref:Uncharacterized protein n=1 Tax=Amycolatopsis dongchuanensis TaxID=1070866 RepID=A0ABP8VPY2_9PSEU